MNSKKNVSKQISENLIEDQPVIDNELRRELLVLAYTSIKEGSERGIIRKYQDINSDLSNDLFFTQLHKDLKQSNSKGILFGLCISKGLSLYPSPE